MDKAAAERMDVSFSLFLHVHLNCHPQIYYRHQTNGQNSNLHIVRFAPHMTPAAHDMCLMSCSSRPHDSFLHMCRLQTKYSYLFIHVCLKTLQKLSTDKKLARLLFLILFNIFLYVISWLILEQLKSVAVGSCICPVSPLRCLSYLRFSE